MPLRSSADAAGVTFAVKVVPGASRDRVMGLLGDALKVAVSRPPSGGAANEAVVDLLAEVLGVARQHVSIVRGLSNPRKEVRVSGIGEEELIRRLGV
jgi:uncharacterized protein (TIGR00251 family)